MWERGKGVEVVIIDRVLIGGRLTNVQAIVDSIDTNYIRMIVYSFVGYDNNRNIVMHSHLIDCGDSRHDHPDDSRHDHPGDSRHEHKLVSCKRIDITYPPAISDKFNTSFILQKHTSTQMRQQRSRLTLLIHPVCIEKTTSLQVHEYTLCTSILPLAIQVEDRTSHHIESIHTNWLVRGLHAYHGYLIVIYTLY